MSELNVLQVIQQDNMRLRVVQSGLVKLTDDEIEKLDKVFIGVNWVRRVKKNSPGLSIGEDSTFELHFMQPEVPGYLELFRLLRDASLVKVAFFDVGGTKEVMTVTFDYCDFVQESVVARVSVNAPMSRVFKFTVSDILDKEV